MEQTDYADEEVKGLARLTPTAFSKYLATALVSLPWLVFIAVRTNIDWFSPNFSSDTGKLLLPLFAAVIALLVVALLLVWEYATLLNARKHRRITQYTTRNPELTFGWLFKNASTSQWLALIGLAAFCALLGFYAGKT